MEQPLAEYPDEHTKAQIPRPCLPLLLVQGSGMMGRISNTYSVGMTCPRPARFGQWCLRCELRLFAEPHESLHSI